MIVPMKKVSLVILGDKKTETLQKLRGLGILHIEITEGRGRKLEELSERLSLLEKTVFLLEEFRTKDTEIREAGASEALSIAREVQVLTGEKKELLAQRSALASELERLSGWGDIDPRSVSELAAAGLDLSFYEMSNAEYEGLGECVRTICLEKTRSSVKFMIVNTGMEGEEEVLANLSRFRLALPQEATAELRRQAAGADRRIGEIDKTFGAYAAYIGSIQDAIRACEKEMEFEIYRSGMEEEDLSDRSDSHVNVACFTGYVEAKNADRLKAAAREYAWGLLVEEPSVEDNVPTKLENNKLVSLIYPLTDFLGTVPGYFEYDISAWFLGFILIFFGIIFGDGGYGLLICGAVAVPIIKALRIGKPVSPMLLLIGLFGLATILWGALTCTWFGVDPAYLPGWLKALSVPVISNVYADRLWYPFWMQEQAGGGLTKEQNLQIVCFSLALIQLSAAHIKGAVRNRGSLKLLGDIGSILQLTGMFYVVLSLVVNAGVFPLGLVIGGIPVGLTAVGLVAVGFVMSFVFSNYEGSIAQSILASLVNIVSVLLGVVNVFGDIVSYIRLWAVGLAGAAISATVNELAGPLFGRFAFMIFAIFILVFGHGLNMILNVLSVIVHGIRLNTLEFSGHLDMSWSGHKFKPFES